MADDKKQKTLFLDDAAAAAPPRPSQPVSSQSTMMLEAPSASGPRPVVTPTMMKQPPQQQLPPMQRPAPPSTLGRWIVGPLLSAIIAAGTVYAAGIVMPRHKKGQALGDTGKPQGKLKISTTPPGVSILVDGRRHPRFTPTTIEADVGSTLKLTFLSDGYQTKEEEVFVAAGEHSFATKLDPVAAPAPAAPVAPAPVVPAPSHHEHHHGGATAAAKPEPAGTATISVRVRPWAIVFVDKQRLKQTPIDQYQLPSGKHVIELVNEGKNRREKIEVSLKPGEEQEIHRDWEK